MNILQDMGPTFVKIGQIASQQSAYLPGEYCDALAQLRSRVAPMEISRVYSQIEKYPGKPAEEFYASFDEKPLGSASIGQVHRPCCTTAPRWQSQRLIREIKNRK